jgi:hypothetical protein
VIPDSNFGYQYSGFFVIFYTSFSNSEIYLKQTTITSLPFFSNSLVTIIIPFPLNPLSTKEFINQKNCFENEWIYTSAPQYTFMVSIAGLPLNFTFTCHVTALKSKEELGQGLACSGQIFCK